MSPVFNVRDSFLLLSLFLAFVAPIVFGDTLIGVSAAGGSLPSDVSVARAKRVQDDNSLVGFETESESELGTSEQELKLKLSWGFSCQTRIRGSKLETTVVEGGHDKGETATQEKKWCTKFALCRLSPTNSYSASLSHQRQCSRQRNLALYERPILDTDNSVNVITQRQRERGKSLLELRSSRSWDGLLSYFEPQFGNNIAVSNSVKMSTSSVDTFQDSSSLSEYEWNYSVLGAGSNS